MNNKTTLFIATLFTALLSGQSAFAGQAPQDDEYSVTNLFSATEKTEQRVNLSMDMDTITVDLDAELFPSYER